MNRMQSISIPPLPLRERLKARWDHPFVICPARAVTYSTAEYFRIVDRVGACLRTAGLGPGDSLCVLLDNSSRVPALFLACVLQDIAFVPIDAQKGVREIEDILAMLPYEGAISGRADVAPHGVRIPVEALEACFAESPADASRDEALLAQWEHFDVQKTCLVTFTSGTTDRPKGVRHSFASLAASALAFNTHFGFDHTHCFYHNLPMSYMAGLLNLLILPLLAGSRVVIGERFHIGEVSRFWQVPNAYDVNAFWFNPTMLSLLLKLDRGREGIEYARRVSITGCVGTAPLPQAVKEAFEARYAIALHESYGLSETLFVSTNGPHEPQRPGSVGRLLPGVRLRFDADAEILIEVPWMFQGYLQHDQTPYFAENAYRSGDLGCLDEAGHLHITGRKKDLIIRGGMNLSPRRVEEFLIRLGLVEEVMVIGAPDAVMGEKTVCAYVPASDQAMSRNELEKALNQQLTDALGRDYRLDAFLPLEMLPRNSNGKLDRNQVKALYAEKAR